MQLKDDKVSGLYIFTMNGKQLLKVSDHFTFHKQGQQEDLLIIKGINLPVLPKNAKVNLVLNGKDGTRVSFDSVISMSMPQQLNVLFSQIGSKALEERRRYFKMYCEIKCAIRTVTRDGATVDLEPPPLVLVKNINLGGVYLAADMKKVVLKLSDIFTVFIPDILGSKLHLTGKVLRVQPAISTEEQGYGCCFVGLSPNDEQILARYITQLQLEKRKSEGMTY
ncbi:MAG: PilZ domain-containing protein [Oscillospiraceae bacterium]|nr:PilZ domain-containing protein [Oscillospiraceae bacterium]